MVGPIYFNVPEARDYLMAHGRVYSIRHSRGVGRTHARWGNRRVFQVLAKVKVSLAVLDYDIYRSAFEPLLAESGFPTLEAWTAAADPGAKCVYLVEVVPDE